MTSSKNYQTYSSTDGLAHGITVKKTFLGKNYFHDELHRINTFKYWSMWNKENPIQLAQRGFFYNGIGSVIICAFCEHKFDLESGDIWKTHETSSTRCFVKCLRKNKKWIPETQV